MLRRSFDSGGTIESLPIRLFGVVRDSIVDGPGLRYVVFVQGCPHRCPGCHNPGSHDYTGGKLTVNMIGKRTQSATVFRYGFNFSKPI